MQNYIRLNVVSIAEVLPHIVSRNKSKPTRAIFCGESVKVSSLRLQTFAKSTICSSCGLEAKYFALEKTLEKDPYHLNLYGVKNGKEVLFTHDHTLARSLGGRDNISNTTTMCTHCNFEKSKGERVLAEKLRKEKQQKDNYAQI